MRSGSLSDPKVISLITDYFIPVTVSRDSYAASPPSRQEAIALVQLDRSAKTSGVGGGGVCAYILNKNGAVVASKRVHDACKAAQLIPMLEKQIEKLEAEKRPPTEEDKKKRALRKKSYKTESLYLHIWTRYLERRKSWGLSEDILELTSKEWQKLIPDEDSKKGDTIEVPKAVIEKLYLLFYPPGPNWRQGDGEILQAKLHLKVESSTEEERTARLEGEVELSHPFGGKNTPGKVTARLVGRVVYDAEEKKITTFQLVSTAAEFVWKWKGKPLPEKIAIAVDKEETEEIKPAADE